MKKAARDVVAWVLGMIVIAGVFAVFVAIAAVGVRWALGE